MTTEIPTFTDLDVYTVEVDLSDVSYSLRFVWSERALLWIMDIRRVAEDEPVMLGVACVGGTVLNLGHGEPEGSLVIIGDRDPQRYDWGTRCKLVYVQNSDT